MRRFLMLLGVAAVAGAMYGAAASGSQQSKGPTAKQFAALKKQVAALQKTVKNTQTVANGTAVVLLHCTLDQVVPVDQLGDTNGTGTFGYSFTAANGGGVTLTSALDIAPDPNAADWRFPGYNRNDPQCMNFVGTLPLRHYGPAGVRTALQHYAALLAGTR